MATQSDWLPLSEAFALLNADTIPAAEEIIGRGKVPVKALRDDIRSIVPERVETMLAKAIFSPKVSPNVYRESNGIYALYDGRQDRAIFGPHSHWRDYDYPINNPLAITFSGVRVHWPSLVEALEEAGYAVPKGKPGGARSTSPQRLRLTKAAAVKAFIAKTYPNGIPAGVTDKEIARDTKTSERTVRRVRTGKK